MMDVKKIVADNRIAFLAIVFLLLLSLYSLVQLFLFFSSRLSVTASVAKPITVSRQIPDIGSWHLFGGYLGALPETQLQLVLQGIFLATDAAKSQALIAEPGATAKVYMAGDVVPGGAKIDKILSEHVVLLNKGKLESLLLQRSQLQFAPPPKGFF